ncbi:MAG TPA: hypothetical protein VFJ85_09215 [Acidimicrobiales bacterium]|nr:hypothetical protein [Acidimicrobiales bacterium]
MSILDALPDASATRLANARAALASAAQVDESRLLPARLRYAGSLYAAVGDAVERQRARRPPVVIISGGYGLVTAEEPIGTYDRRFAIADWPKGLLHECLEALVTDGVQRVLAFCAATTPYAELIRRARWRAMGVQATLVSPSMAGHGGAQVLVPRALGEAFASAVAGNLTTAWTSSDGVGLVVEDVAR